jgi:hypothetical protein
MCCSTQACVACLSCLNVDFLIQKKWIGPTVRFESLIRPSHSLMTESLIMCSYRLLATLSHEPELVNRVRVAVSESLTMPRSDMTGRAWCSSEWGRAGASPNGVEPAEVRYGRPGLVLPRMGSSWLRSGMVGRAWCSPEWGRAGRAQVWPAGLSAPSNGVETAGLSAPPYEW